MNGRKLLWAGAVAAGLLVLVATRGDGGQPRCDGCGQHGDCQKVCRLVCEEKKVEIVCWGQKREEFCLPGHSKRSCKHVEQVCDDCEESSDPDEPHSPPKKFVWYDWIGGCAEKTCVKHKLMKKTVTRKVPTFKWVVEALCHDCQQAAQQAKGPPEGVQLPPPPVVQARRIIGQGE